MMRLDRDHGVAGVLRLADAAVHQPGDEHDDEQGGKIGDEVQAEQGGSAGPGVVRILQGRVEVREAFSGMQKGFGLPVASRGGEVVHCHPLGQMDVHAGQQSGEVVGPGDRHGDVPDSVFHDQRPADDPGDDLAEGDVAVRISGAGNGHDRGELGIGEGREAAGDGGEEEQQDHTRTAVRAGVPDRAEDPGADDGRDAQRGQVAHAQVLRQLMPVTGRPRFRFP